MPVLAVLLLSNLAGVSFDGFLRPRPSPTLARRQAEQALSLVVADLRAFVEDYDELPESRAEIGVPIDAVWRYTVTTESHFRVGVTWHGQHTEFESWRRPPRMPTEGG